MSLMEMSIDGIPITQVGRSLMLRFPPRVEPPKRRRRTRPIPGRPEMTSQQRKQLALELMQQGPGDQEARWLNRLRRLRRTMEAKREDTSFLPPRGTQARKILGEK